MRITISLPKPGESPDGTVAACLRLARASEDAGASAVSVTDHPFPYLPDGAPGHQSHDPFTLLGFLAAKTSTVHLQISLLVAGYRNPHLAARMIATLDQVSEGRTMVTLGAGYQQVEFAALGVPFAERGQRLLETASAMRAAWSGDPVHTSGQGWTAAGNTLVPGCVQSPHPPLWRGGNTPAALAHVAGELDGWAALEVGESRAPSVRTTSLRLEDMPAAVARLHELWNAAGRAGRPDVSLVRTRTDWLSDTGRLREEVAALATAGVTWIEVNPAGETAAEQERSVVRTMQELDAAGLLDAAESRSA
jgi:probable F420-dependent oxidoreductase